LLYWEKYVWNLAFAATVTATTIATARRLPPLDLRFFLYLLWIVLHFPTTS